MLLKMDEITYKQLDKEIQKTHYNVQRYGSLSTFGLLYFDGDLDNDTLHHLLRLSDFFLRLDTHHYFLTFYNTSEEAALKAAENLIFKLDKVLNNNSSYIAVDRIDTKESTKSTFNRLYQILQEAKKHHNNRVEDENILNELY